jgi:nucleoside-diphosphate-sugar epimerase
VRVLLIGGNGFIGLPLTRQLVAAGHQVAILHRGSAPDFPDFEVIHIQGDRDSLSAYRKPIAQFLPDVVVDLILSSGEQARQLMDEAAAWTRRVVAISSMDVYRAWGVLHGAEAGAVEPLPLTEDSPVRAVRPIYPVETLSMLRNTFTWLNNSYDKIAVEEAVMDHPRLAGTALRLPMVYGPGDRLHRFFPLLKRVADRRPAIPMADDFACWRGPRGYVENVAHAIVLAACQDRAAGRIYNVCHEPCFSELDWQGKIAAAAGWDGRFVVVSRERTPRQLLQPGNAAQHVVTSSARIRTELGYKEPVDLEEGIRRTIVWEQQNPPASITAFDYEAEDRAMRGEA